MISPQVLINQIFELQQKVAQNGLAEGFERNFSRLFNIFEEEGFIIEDPTGQPLSESRTDYEASIVGSSSSSLKITRTIKPVIYHRKNGETKLLQKGIVIAEKK